MTTGITIPRLVKLVIAGILISAPLTALKLQAQTQAGTAWNPAAHAGSDGLWSTATNWTGGVVPVSGTKAFFNVSPVVPCVINGTAGGCQISVGDGGPGELIVTNGGNLTAGDTGLTGLTNIDDYAWTGIGETATGTMIIESNATVTFLYHVFIGYSSTANGTFIMNGGTASIQNPTGAFAIGTDGGTGVAQLYGGSLAINNNLQIPNAGPQVDVAGGTLTINLNGNTNNTWDPLISAGKIVAYGGAGTLIVVTNGVSDQIIITATTNSTAGGGGGNSNTNTTVSTGGAYLTNSFLPTGQSVLSWNSRGTLEMATNVGGPWTAVTNSWPYTNQITGATAFFRLNQTVDTTTLHKKLLCGYQGWFRCAGDDGGTGDEWDHWSRNWSAAPTTSTLTFEMWPDLTEYTNDNQYVAPLFTYPGGAQAYLYSALDQATVNLHFDWMREYGIDGVVVQRFVTQTAGQPGGEVQPWKTNVLLYARAAANRTGRAFFVQYDMSGANTNTLFYQLTNDWAYLNSLNIPQDPRYMHQNGKPVIMVFGFYAPSSQASPPEFTNSPALDLQIAEWFETNSIQPATFIGSGEWQWGSETTPGWSNLFAHCDGFCPWNTGNYVNNNGTNYASLAPWTQGQAFANKTGVFFWPQIYPGYSASHLTGNTFNELARNGGNFLWNQINTLGNMGIDSAYLGMFDEVDEGTAIYKVSNNPPTQAQFLTYDEDGYTLPTDWYLRLTAEGSKVLAGERPNVATIPIAP